MRRVPINDLLWLLPAAVAIAIMMFFAHFPWMILVVFVIWLIWNIIKWKIESAVGRRREDITTIEEQNNEINRLRERLIDEKMKSSTKYNEDSARRRKLLELEEILNSSRKK